ncbi:MAG: hypothetical protein EBX50_02610 [Chitinophagia bacterium]|nr:hypothetical protein [Chitinophagia bacterium]
MTSRLNQQMRIYHRYLGFFLAGIMLIYSLSGIVLIFRNTDFLKQEVLTTKKLEPNASEVVLKEQLKIKDFFIEREENGIVYLKNGEYNKATGIAIIRVKELPKFLNKLTQFHKAKTGDRFYYMNIFFGLSLFFFVISSFWMFMPNTTIFKKGMYFVLAGIALAVILLIF